MLLDVDACSDTLVTMVCLGGTGKSTQKNLPAKATAIDQALTSHAKEHKRKGQGVKVNETSAKPVVKYVTLMLVINWC